MDNQVLKYALVGLGIYVTYEYLQKSGLWAQWFGGQTFTDAASLLAYCAQNPTGEASFNGQTATCQAWLQAAQGTGFPEKPPAAQQPTKPSVDPSVVASDVQLLLQAAGVSSSQLYNPDQWDYYWMKLTGKPSAASANDAAFWPNGRPNDPSQYPQITAQQWMSAISAQGISGLGSPKTAPNPYYWVN